MWDRDWGELQFGEVRRCKTAELSRRKGKSDCGCVGAFWDDVEEDRL